MWGRTIFSNRKTKAFFIGCLAALSLGASSYLLPEPVKLAAMAKIDDMSDAITMLASRSPGERTKAELTKAKLRKAAIAGLGDGDDGKAAKAPAEDEPAPKRARSIPGSGDEASEIVSVPGPLAQSDGLGIPGLGVPIDGAPSGGGPGFIGPGTVPGFPGGGGGGGFLPLEPDPDTPVPVEPPISAVPEPGMWAMMIIGMGLCGAMLRRRSRVVAKQSILSSGSRAS